MRLRGMNLLAWLTSGARWLALSRAAKSRHQASRAGHGFFPLSTFANAVGFDAAQAVVPGMARVNLPEDLEPVSLPTELAASYVDWLVHPSWGAALLGLATAVWFTYRRHLDLRRAKAARAASGELYEAIFQAIPCPMFCKDGRGKYLAVNRAYEKAFGVEAALSSTFDARSADERCRIGESPECGSAGPRDAKDGRTFPSVYRNEQAHRFRIAVLDFGKGNEGCVGMLADGESDAQSYALEVPHAYSEGAVDYALLSAINHDVRTPLTGILGALELLDYSELTDRQRELLHSAEGASKALQVILDDVLALAKLETGMASREHLPFDFRQVVMDAIGGFEGQADIVNELDGQLAQRLLGDGARLRQALTKLVAHALSRKLDKSWRLEVRVLAQDARWQLVECALEAQGEAGVAETPVFPFPMDAHRADELSWIVACKLCEWMGLVLREQGRSWSEPRFVVQGCFSLALDAPEEDRISLGRSRTKSATILVAEDHELVREVIGHQLATLGWDCDLVEDGESALEALARGSYALLITDRYMPGMDGLELARRVRSVQGDVRMPIVLLTANLAESEQDSFSDVGIDQVMCKPTSLQSLSSLLARWVGNAQSESVGEARCFAERAADDADQVIERLRSVFGDDAGSVEDYLHLLRNEQGRLIKRLEEGDTGRIREIAHSLSGMGSFFGAQWLAGLATSVERAESAASVIAHAGELSAYLIELIALLQTRAYGFSSTSTQAIRISDGSYRNVSGPALEL